MEREPDRRQTALDADTLLEEPPPYAPDPRLMSLLERDAHTDTAAVWAKLKHRNEKQGRAKRWLLAHLRPA